MGSEGTFAVVQALLMEWRFAMRTFLVAAVLAAVGLCSMVRGEAATASACSGPEPTESMLASTVIFEGRVKSVVPTGEPVVSYRVPNVVTFEVVHAHLGTKAGETITARAFVPVPDTPIMCAQFPKDFTGKWVVIGLSPDPEAPNSLLADASVVPFIGDKREGEQYQRASSLARMMSDSDSTAPALTVGKIAKCGEPLRFTGRRFQPGTYILRPNSGGRSQLVIVGPNDAFDVTEKFVHWGCRRSDWEGRVVGFHVYKADHDSAYDFENWNGLVEIGTATMSGAVDRNPQGTEIEITPNPARCDDKLTIRGRGFEPGERVVVLPGQPSSSAIEVDAKGEFMTYADIPPENCQRQWISVKVSQADFEEFDVPWFVITGRDVLRTGPSPDTVARSTPQAPNLGSGGASANADTAAKSSVTSGLVIAVAFGLLGSLLLALSRYRIVSRRR